MTLGKAHRFRSIAGYGLIGRGFSSLGARVYARKCSSAHGLAGAMLSKAQSSLARSSCRGPQTPLFNIVRCSPNTPPSVDWIDAT